MTILSENIGKTVLKHSEWLNEQTKCISTRDVVLEKEMCKLAQ